MPHLSTTAKALTGFLLAMTLLAGMAAIAYRSGDELITSSHELKHTYQVLAALQATEAALDEATAANSGYVITASPAALRDRDAALSRLESSLTDLNELTAADVAERARLDGLERQIAERQRGMDDVALARQTEEFEAARAVAFGGAQRDPAMIMTTLRAIEAGERTVLEARSQADQRWTRRFPLALAALLIAAGVLLGALFLRIRRDLLERSRLDAELRQGSRLLESIIDNIPHMIFLKEARELRFARLNKAGEELIGIPRARLLGTRDHDWFPAEQADAFTRRDREALTHQGVVDIVEETLDTQQLGQRILHTKKLAILDEAGQPAYLLGISHDITERKASEQRVLALNAALQQQTGRLAAANQELEGFTSSVSHDLRSPLRAIEGFARMLEEDCAAQLGEDGRRYVATIRAGSQRMATLIEDLLSFARLSRHELRAGAVNMEQLAAEARREVLGERTPAPVLSAGALPAAAGDAALLKQVWLNLVGNAAKYSANRPDPTIEIGGEVQGQNAVYRVRDNGVGFDPRYAHKLFGVFQRLHRTEEFEGTGVGLAIVHRIITRHGGRVWAESEPGRGATFYFTLPLAAAA